MNFLYEPSPLGPLLLTADEAGLTGLWFADKGHAPCPSPGDTQGETAVLAATRRWLDVYFSGREPDFMPPIHLMGTPFRQEVWALLRQIPYGQTTTYGALAQQLARSRGIPKMAAQAVGGAVGANPVCILVPCHRVIGTGGSLIGYGGGLENKIALLRLESPQKF